MQVLAVTSCWRVNIDTEVVSVPSAISEGARSASGEREMSEQQNHVSKRPTMPPNKINTNNHRDPNIGSTQEAGKTTAPGASRGNTEMQTEEPCNLLKR